ncbi:hypothetical protein [Undibacterium sp. Xuan67W]|uniref:hypothetical protein n=1 Tax=Undibacterium sp. Xuan67W TaxID=3413057 RepID=UPI003BF42498
MTHLTSQITSMIRTSTVALTLACSAVGLTTQAALAASCLSCGASGLSLLSALSGAVLIEGSAEGIQASGTLLVVSVEKIADGVIVVFKGVSDGAKYSVKLTGKAMGNVSVVAGTVVQVTALSAGTMLVVSGQAIAYIPNEIGRSLVHHSVAR